MTVLLAIGSPLCTEHLGAAGGIIGATRDGCRTSRLLACPAESRDCGWSTSLLARATVAQLRMPTSFRSSGAFPRWLVASLQVIVESFADLFQISPLELRHLNSVQNRNMSPKTPAPRKKSCNHCGKAKVRCDLARPVCTRCRTRDLYCEYADGRSPDQFSELTSPDPAINTSLVLPAISHQSSGAAEVLNFDNVQLVCVVDEARVRARWLESVLPSIDQTPKPFTSSTMGFVAHIFKSYPGIFLIDEALPPFIHWAQISGKPCEQLANCTNIARLWETQAAGSANMVQDIIEQEMTRLFNQESSLFPCKEVRD